MRASVRIGNKRMTLHKRADGVSQKLPGEAYLLKDTKNLQEMPKSVSIVLLENGFNLYSYADGTESLAHEAVRYSETLIRCSLNELDTSPKPFVIQLEAGLRTIFICFIERDERDSCFTKILASVGQFLVLNPRSRKSPLGKRVSNPLSPVSPLSMGAAVQQEHLSSLVNALDISSSRCLASTRPNSTFSFKFPALLVSIYNARKTLAKSTTNAKIPVARSYTLPFSKFGSARSCKRYSARNTLFCSENQTQSSLEARAALGILNTDLGDVRQYFARS